MEFVKREEDSKSSDFSVQLMTDEKSERVTKYSDKSSVFPAVKVKKTLVQIENSNCRTGVGKLNGGSFPVKGVCVSENRNNDSVILPPQCFVCRLQNSDSCHKIVNCQTFRRMTPSKRKEIVFKARRCFNCLEKHVVKDCVKNCDCRKCLGSNVGKHFFMLHDCFVSTVPKSPNSNARFARDGNIAGHSANENFSVPVRNVKIGSTKAALNRIVAARVINPHNGKSKLVYCQQDGGSQLTLVSNKLVQELNLIPYDQASFRMVTLKGETLTHTNLVKLNLQSLFSNEMFELSNVVTNRAWQDDVETLPHRQDLNSFSHFEDVELYELPYNDTVDLLIGNDNAFLMTVLEERVGVSRCEPHAVLTLLGWLVCGGKSPLEEQNVKVCRVQTYFDLSSEVLLNQEIISRDEKISELEQALRDITLQDEKIESSRSDREARKFVEAHVVVKDSRFEIPVSLKTGVVAIPDNMAVAKNRLENLKKKALKDTDLREFLTECFCELQELNYTERVDDSEMLETPVWYLPYFVTSQAKKRIVYDGKAAFNGVCINDFIETGPDLLNPLADILARFRLGKFAMMADLTKCFFQIGVLQNSVTCFAFYGLIKTI